MGVARVTRLDDYHIHNQSFRAWATCGVTIYSICDFHKKGLPTCLSCDVVYEANVKIGEFDPYAILHKCIAYKYINFHVEPFLFVPLVIPHVNSI